MWKYSGNVPVMMNVLDLPPYYTSSKTEQYLLVFNNYFFSITEQMLHLKQYTMQNTHHIWKT